MKRATTLTLATLACAAMMAQATDNIKPFSKFDGGITVGTTGVGFEISTPLHRDWDIRAGFDFMPHFTHDMRFDVTVGDENTSGEITESRFQKMSSMLYEATGFRVDNKVVMEGKPNMYNFKLLVDFKPFQDKRWHITAGFYWGSSKIATAENAKEDMTSLFSVGIYNNLYDKAYYYEPYAHSSDGTPIYLPDNISDKLLEYGRMAIHVGTYKRDILYLVNEYYKENVYYTDDVYYSGPDVYYTEGEIGADGLPHHANELKYVEGDILHKAGDVKYQAGVDIEHRAGEVMHKAGDPYNIEPNEDCMVKAHAKVNKFKPYLGFGFMGKLTDKDPRWKIGFDAGVLFWGGTPELKTHDGTDLINDVTVTRHGVNHYVKLIKAAKVMPVINLRITRTL